MRAITSDNIQLLPILACQKFGATLAISPEALADVRKRVLKAPNHRVVKYLKILIGWNLDNTVSIIGGTHAGVRFLGLVSTLTSSIELYNSGVTIGKILAKTGENINYIPHALYLSDLLAAIQPRYSLLGFGNIVAGY